MRAVISYQNLEKGLQIVKNPSNFIPATPEQMNEYLLEGYNKLISKIYLAEGEVMNLFTFNKDDTEEGELEIGGLSDCLDAIDRGYFTLADLINNSISALKYNEASANLSIKELDEATFEILNQEKESIKIKIDKTGLKVKDFILIRQNFFEKLNCFRLLEPEFLDKILQFIKTSEGKSLSYEDFLNLFKVGENFNLMLAYACIFFVIESISGVKKNWIF